MKIKTKFALIAKIVTFERNMLEVKFWWGRSASNQLFFIFPTSRVYTDVGKMSQIFSVARPLKFRAVIGLAAV